MNLVPKQSCHVMLSLVVKWLLLVLLHWMSRWMSLWELWEYYAVGGITMQTCMYKTLTRSGNRTVCRPV